MSTSGRPVRGLVVLLFVGLLGSAAGASAQAPEVEPADRIVYLVLTDRFANGDPTNDRNADPAELLAWHGGDLRGLRERLPYLAELGVTTLWITPVVEQVEAPVINEAHPPHWGYHGYWAEHFDRLDPRLGTEAELDELLAAARGAGLEVVLDVVLNHPGYGAHFVSEPGWVRECPGPDDPHDDLTQCLFGLPDFRTEDPEVARQLIAWQTAWFERFPFDGLRADTVKHVEAEVWRQFLEAVRAARGDDPGFWALGESWGTAPATGDEPWLEPGLFDALYDFGFADLVEGWLNGRMRSAALAHHLRGRNDDSVGRYVHYLNTHDTTTMTARLEEAEAYPVALVLLLTSAGMPLLYYGDEVAREGGDWPHNRPDMPWERVEDPTGTPLGLVRELIATRRAHPALSRGTYESLAAEEGLVVFARAHGEDRVVVAVNRGPEPATFPCGEGTPVGSCEVLVCWSCLAGEAEVGLLPFGAAVLGGR
jgi:glycosidase